MCDGAEPPHLYIRAVINFINLRHSFDEDEMANLFSALWKKADYTRVKAAPEIYFSKVLSEFPGAFKISKENECEYKLEYLDVYGDRNIFYLGDAAVDFLLEKEGLINDQFMRLHYEMDIYKEKLQKIWYEVAKVPNSKTDIQIAINVLNVLIRKDGDMFAAELTTNFIDFYKKYIVFMHK